MLICYKAASDPQACFACILSCILQEFYSFFKFIFKNFFLSSSNALKCFPNDPTNSDHATSETTSTHGYIKKNDSCLLGGDIEVVMQRLGMSLDESNDEEFREHIGFKEILGLFEEDEPKMEEVKEAFDVFDENGDGFIDAKELKMMIRKLGFGEASEEECRRMIKTFDYDRDGKISVGEFVKLLEHSFSN
ncbi:hypothetical protein Leryth_014244 [Lithospermum erythrorhizon]|nr:hypothetical protein Leryth_014244 [Lithospermum erythrorhizon]